MGYLKLRIEYFHSSQNSLVLIFIQNEIIGWNLWIMHVFISSKEAKFR